MKARIWIWPLLVALLVSACASGKSVKGRKDSGLGVRVLECVVVEREREGPGQGGASYAGTGNYYMVFETREGEATARYRLQVTRQQWFRFTEGSRVRITLSNNILQDIRPLE
jgi:hypothetical protein